MIVTLIHTGSSLEKMAKLINPKFFPHLVRSVRKGANTVLREWLKDIEKSNAKIGHKRKYQNEVNIEPQTSPMEATVSSEGMGTNFVENGIKRFDMKPGLLGSSKAKINKKGQPYIIVSFRHGTPGSQNIPAMPRKVYEAMQESNGPLLQDRIRNIPGMDEDIGKFRGMVKTGKKGHEQYRTFRVVSQKSKGWIYPGIPASPVFDNMTKRVEPIVRKEMQKGLTKDLQEEADKIK